MYLYDHNNKLIKFDISKYHTNNDVYYAYYKIKYNITIPKHNKITEEKILEYLNDNKNLFSL
jgi:hypothetical protein